MNSHMPAILVVMVLLVGCRDAQPRHGPEAAMTSEALPARSSVMPVDGGSGETPGGLSGEVAAPAITVVTSALAAVTSAPESNNRARVGELADPPAPEASPTPAPVGHAGSNPALSTTPTSAQAADGQYSAAEGSLEAEVWAAIMLYFPSAQWAMAMRVARCESGGTFDPAIVGKAGERGIYQIRPEFWGSVPPDIEGQTAQAASIVARHSWAPWSCR